MEKPTEPYGLASPAAGPSGTVAPKERFAPSVLESPAPGRLRTSVSIFVSSPDLGSSSLVFSLALSSAFSLVFSSALSSAFSSAFSLVFPSGAVSASAASGVLGGSV